MKSYFWQALSVVLAGWINKQQQLIIDYLQEENRVLREQFGDKRIHFTVAQRRRLATKGKKLGRKLLRELGSLVTPDTILRWHRQLIAKKYDGSKSRGMGRPPIDQAIRKLIIQMATENTSWGYVKIVGALSNLGHKVSKSTIKRVLREEGIEPAPKRDSKTTWKTFVKPHWESIVATDFFTVEVWSPFGLIRYHVLFIIELSTRKVEIAGIHAHPHGAWMEQIARNLTDCFDGLLRNKRILIHDRGSLFTEAFEAILKDAGVEAKKLPAKSPILNSFAELFVRTIKEECVERMIFVSEKQLRRVIDQFMEHYHRERNHQGLDNRLIIENPMVGGLDGDIECRERVGGLLKYYYRRAT